MQAEVKVTQPSHMDELVNSDTRIILLYSTKVTFNHLLKNHQSDVAMQGEANDIMGWAAERGLTGTNFVWEQLDKHFFLSIGSKTWIFVLFCDRWVVTQSVIGEMSGQPPRYR